MKVVSRYTVKKLYMHSSQVPRDLMYANLSHTVVVYNVRLGTLLP